MPESIEIRVVPRNQRWEVSANGVTRRLIDWLCTKERAVEHAIQRARELRVRSAVVVVERADGSIEQRLVAA
jgi:hypothetical protein